MAQRYAGPGTWCCTNWYRVVLLASCLYVAPGMLSGANLNEPGGSRPGTYTDGLQPMLLMVDINQQGLNETALILKGADGDMYASEADLQKWRLRLPAAAPVLFRAARYYRLSAFPDMVAVVDATTQSLNMDVSPDTFTSTDLRSPRSALPEPVSPSPGMFFNYDLIAERPNGGESWASGLFELGAFNAFGNGMSTFALQKGEGQLRTMRLDTSLTVDQPHRVASFRLGDAVTRPAAAWGRAIRFGGVQYSTNFATQPGLITFPIQTFAGQAALPSTVDVFVNNTLASRRQVPPGPFSITDIPLVTGSGDVSVVVRDILGREQAITQPFYASPTLLREGLQDFSIESGALRENYGTRSSDYGALFAAGTYRIGVFDYMTGEAHLEWLEGRHATAGLSALTLHPALGTLSTSAAASRSDEGHGHLWAVGYERQSRLFSFGVRTRQATANFRQLGSVPGFPAPRRMTSINIGVSAGAAGSVGSAYIRQDFSGMGRTEVASITYSLSLGRAGMLGISAFKTLQGTSNHSISAFWSLPLDRNLNASASHTASGTGSDQTRLQLQRNLPPGDGYGYRIQSGANVPHQGALQIQNRVGSYTLEAATFEGRSSARAGVAGGIAVLGGSAFLGRRIIESFGLVQVPGMDNVRIYVDNQLVARTDADGNALLPRLRPYDNNPVRVEQLDLPMNAKIHSLSANAVPYSRSGVVVRFPIERPFGALMKLVSDDGHPLPPGATVQVEGQENLFPVAMEGAVYVTGLKETNRLRASWNGRACVAIVAYKESGVPVPDMGIVECSVVRR